MSAVRSKMQSLLEVKGWTVNSIEWEAVTYNGREGREGGWFIEFETEYDNDDYSELIDNIKTPLPVIGVLISGLISAYNSKDVITLIGLIPNRLTAPGYGTGENK